MNHSAFLFPPNSKSLNNGGKQSENMNGIREATSTNKTRKRKRKENQLRRKFNAVLKATGRLPCKRVRTRVGQTDRFIGRRWIGHHRDINDPSMQIKRPIPVFGSEAPFFFARSTNTDADTRSHTRQPFRPSLVASCFIASADWLTHTHTPEAPRVGFFEKQSGARDSRNSRAPIQERLIGRRDAITRSLQSRPDGRVRLHARARRWHENDTITTKRPPASELLKLSGNRN